MQFEEEFSWKFEGVGITSAANIGAGVIYVCWAGKAGHALFPSCGPLACFSYSIAHAE